MRIFELRACWAEYYDCPDNGRTFVGDTYDTVAFEINGTSNLTAIADDLDKGFNNGPWSESRAKALQKLYPGYDDFRGTTYEIVEVTRLIVGEKSDLALEDECQK